MDAEKEAKAEAKAAKAKTKALRPWFKKKRMRVFAGKSSILSCGVDQTAELIGITK
jgi:hypothetical protein